MKENIIKNRGSVALLYLIRNDLREDINILCYRILCQLCEDIYAREIVSQDHGFEIAYE
jgi:hypothetical protein